MDFELTEEQAMLREVSRTMLSTHCPPARVRSLVGSGGDIDDKLWQHGVELGWTGLAAPEQLGGSAQGLVELSLVAEEIGRAVVPGPVVETALVALAAARSGHPELAPVAAALANGQARASLAHHGTVRAVRDGDALVLDGHVTAVQAAAAVDWLLVTASTDGGPAAVLVPTPPGGTRRRRTLDETRGWYDVTLTGIQVPATHAVAVGPSQVRWLVAAAGVLTAADALGAGERLLEMTVEHVLVREQFGRPLGSFQSVKHKVADMLTLVKGARAATYYAAMALDAGADDGDLAASAAKAFTAEGMSALAGEALQAHGGIGFTWEHDLHLYLRRVKVDEVLFGAPAEHYERVVALLAQARGVEVGSAPDRRPGGDRAHPDT